MDRREIEAQLETIVRDNRGTIAITFPLVGVALLVAGSEGWIPRWLAFHPYLMVSAAAIMALPLVAGILPVIDRRAGVGLAALVGFAWGIELVGVNTGIPYGAFEYQVALGPMLFGDIPLALPVFYFPILLNSYLLGVLALGRYADRLTIRYPVVVGFVLLLDFILDPGALQLGFWTWEHPGAYYGVPLSNFAGWILSGSIAVGVIHFTFDHEQIITRLREVGFFLDDLINFLVFWGLVNLYFGNLVPVALAVAILVGLFRVSWFDFAGLGTGTQSVDR